MIDILFVRPADDSAAIQVAVWGQAVRQMAGSFKTDDLSGPQATRKSVDGKLAAGARHLFWFGHGTTTELIANGQALVDKKNINRLSGGMPARNRLPVRETFSDNRRESRRVVKLFLASTMSWDSPPLPHCR